MLCVKASRKHVDEIEPRFCLHPKSTNTLVISASDFCKKTQKCCEKEKKKTNLTKRKRKRECKQKIRSRNTFGVTSIQRMESRLVYT